MYKVMSCDREICVKLMKYVLIDIKEPQGTVYQMSVLISALSTVMHLLIDCSDKQLFM